jgi:Domain of unknown function (DUF4956)
MPDFLKVLTAEPAADPWVILSRLVTALLLGAIVAWIYRRTTGHAHSVSFPTTLVLLAVLIAMVTQVIGDNVARAFSLVGALSIVRFRTVVRDTRDTAFVIFAVVAGMAAGSQNLWVAILGILVAGTAAFVMAKGTQNEPAEVFVLRLRAVPDLNLDRLLAERLGPNVTDLRLMSIATTGQGLGIEGSYQVRLKPDVGAEGVAKSMASVEGVYDVRISRKELGQD